MRGGIVSRQRGQERRRELTGIYRHWHMQKFYPQHFPTMLGDMKQKDNERVKKGRQGFETLHRGAPKKGCGNGVRT